MPRERMVPLPIPTTEEASKIRNLHLVPPPHKAKAEAYEEVDEEDLIETNPNITRPMNVVPPPASDNADLEDDEPTLPRFEIKKDAEVLQRLDAVPAFEVPGFTNIEVAVTMEKKEQNHGTAKPNEDCFLADPRSELFGIFDGLGGEGKGAEGSLSAAQALPDAYLSALHAKQNVSDTDVLKDLVGRQLKRKEIKNPLLLSKNRTVLTQMAEQMVETDPILLRKAAALVEAFTTTNDSVTRTGGKTTATVGFVHMTPDGTNWGVIASTGDSAGLKRRATSGELVPVTQEDSLLNSLRDAGMLSDDLLERMRQDPETKVEGAVASYLKVRASVVKALGSDDFVPALSVRRLEPGDSLMLVSDGVLDVFENLDSEDLDLQGLADVMNKGNSPKEQAEAVRKETRTRVDLKDDDVVVLIARTKT